MLRSFAAPKPNGKGLLALLLGVMLALGLLLLPTLAQAASTYTIYESVMYPPGDYSVTGHNVTVNYDSSTNVYTMTLSSTSDPYVTLSQTVYLVQGQTYVVHAELINSSGASVSNSSSGGVFQFYYAVSGTGYSDARLLIFNSSGTKTFTAPSTGLYKLRFDNESGATMKVVNFSIGYSKTVTSGSTYGTLATPTRAGNTFSGWNTALDGSGTTVTSDSTVAITGNTVLFAQWTANVTFNANGGTGTMSDQTIDSNQGTVLTANAFSRTGYAFAGWNTASDGTGTSYSDQESVAAISDTTLYAQWEPA